MQFELATSPNPDATRLAAALHPLDPDARIALDVRHGRLEVLTVASASQVQAALESIGWSARALEQDAHVSGGSTCCGGCG